MKGYPFGKPEVYEDPKYLEFYRPKWGYPKGVDAFLKKECVGLTLNVCSGRSTVGDVRIDVMKEHNPDIIADLLHLPFKDKTFDTVICDPPFNYWQQRMKQFAILLELKRLTKTKLILASGLFPRLSVGKAWKREFLIQLHRATLTMKLWQIFTYQNSMLEVWIDAVAKKST